MILVLSGFLTSFDPVGTGRGPLLGGGGIFFTIT
jgi:hypothetical protein